MTVDELLRRISSRELTEWMIYYRLEPFGQDVDWLRAGVIASTIANVNRDPKKQPRPFEPADFIPQTTEAANDDRPQWRRILDATTSALGL